MREMKPTKDATTHELTRAACEHLPGVTRDDYDPNLPLGNPLADATLGQSYNWDKHLVPTNAVAYIRSFDTIAEGVAAATEHAIDSLVEYSPEATIAPITVIAVAKAIAGRFGVGALGERFAANELDAHGEQKPGDEKAGIDLRSDEMTYQVKTAEEARSDWSAKDADALIWVKIGEEWTVERR